MTPVELFVSIEIKSDNPKTDIKKWGRKKFVEPEDTLFVLNVTHFKRTEQEKCGEKRVDASMKNQMDSMPGAIITIFFCVQTNLQWHSGAGILSLISLGN